MYPSNAPEPEEASESEPSPAWSSDEVARVEVRGVRAGAVNVGRLEEANDPGEDLAFGERRGHVAEFACSVFEVDGEL
jgi:hypothetical protein